MDLALGDPKRSALGQNRYPKREPGKWNEVSRMPMVLAENKRTLWPAGKNNRKTTTWITQGSVQLSAWGSVPFVAVKWTVKSMFTESPATVGGQISKVGPAHRSDPMTLTRAGDDLNINARRL